MRSGGSHSSGNVYFTVAYILMTIVIVAQVFYYCFTVYSYQSIKKKLIEQGRLLQVLPVVSITTVSLSQNQAFPNTEPGAIPPPAYPGISSGISASINKEVPPPYTP